MNSSAAFGIVGVASSMLLHEREQVGEILRTQVGRDAAGRSQVVARGHFLEGVRRAVVEVRTRIRHS